VSGRTLVWCRPSALNPVARGADNRTVQHRHERVYLETARHRITGRLTLPADGYRSRLSDFLNASERDFVSLTDVVVEVIGHDGPGTEHDFIVVARNHIVLAIPESGLAA
jgi:uncharacterized protein DUF6812